MVLPTGDHPPASGGASGEVQLNSWPNPSRWRRRAGRVTDVHPPEDKKKKPKLAVVIAAVVVPLLAIVAAAVVTTANSSDDSATATTVSQDGDPDAPPGSSTGGGKASGSGSDGAKVTTSTTSKKAGSSTSYDDVPSTPANTGAEGDRTQVTYPQPTVPAAGCTKRSGTVIITLDSRPSPACLKLGADQPVVVRNRTGKEISFVAISVNEVIAAGTEIRIGTAGKAFGDGRSTFWSPGNPQLSGIVLVG